MTVSGVPPAAVVQGDSYPWTTTVSGASSAQGWTLQTVFCVPAGTPTIIAGVAQPDGSFLSTLTAVQSAALIDGLNAWEMRVAKAPDAHTVCGGRTLVSRSLFSAPPDEVLTPAERYLAALLAIGPSVMATGFAEMEVDGARVRFTSLEDYNKALASAREAVRREEAGLPSCGARPAGNPNKVNVHFTQPRI